MSATEDIYIYLECFLRTHQYFTVVSNTILLYIDFGQLSISPVHIYIQRFTHAQPTYTQVKVSNIWDISSSFSSNIVLPGESGILLIKQKHCD